jgi:hypothetical protein
VRTVRVVAKRREGIARVWGEEGESGGEKEGVGCEREKKPPHQEKPPHLIYLQ